MSRNSSQPIEAPDTRGLRLLGDEAEAPTPPTVTIEPFPDFSVGEQEASELARSRWRAIIRAPRAAQADGVRVHEGMRWIIKEGLRGRDSLVVFPDDEVCVLITIPDNSEAVRRMLGSLTTAVATLVDPARQDMASFQLYESEVEQPHPAPRLHSVQ